MSDSIINAKVVWNPNLYSDMKEYLKLSMSESEIKEKMIEISENIKENNPKYPATIYEKISTLIDKIEFIGHLKIIKEEAISKNFVFSGKEIIGVNHDIDALRLYLAISCVDIFSSDYIKFSDWLIERCTEYDCKESFPMYIISKKTEYEADYTISTNLGRAFEGSSDGLRKSLEDNLTVFREGIESNNIKDIVRFLYGVRNSYTHEGRRVYYEESPKHTNRIIIGVRSLIELTDGDETVLKESELNQSLVNRSRAYMDIAKDFNIISAIIDVAVESCKRTIKSKLKIW